ncbi:hypothetical protein [Rubellimicrobium roseum]|uniref:hypothetical protein n=1 Tax=Rubellimicrobium roseum TaxID=687525 RepID=UPI00159BC946|nr:hypothetical protein [Rubellimicrobium roseum]
MIRIALLVLVLTIMPGFLLWLVVAASMTGSVMVVRGATLMLEARARPLAT